MMHVLSLGSRFECFHVCFRLLDERVVPRLADQVGESNESSKKVYYWLQFIKWSCYVSLSMVGVEYLIEL